MMICGRHAECKRKGCFHNRPHGKEKPACDRGHCAEYSKDAECIPHHEHKPIEFLDKDEFNI